MDFVEVIITILFGTFLFLWAYAAIKVSDLYKRLTTPTSTRSNDAPVASRTVATQSPVRYNRVTGRLVPLVDREQGVFLYGLQL